MTGGARPLAGAAGATPSGGEEGADGPVPRGGGWVRVVGGDRGGRGYDTVGGVVPPALGWVPGPGGRFGSRGLSVEVVEADPRRVWRVRVRPADGRP